MAKTRVLRVPRSDEESGYVLLQVTSKGSRPLDLNLVGTEGEERYVTSLRHDKVASLRVKNCPATEAEWQDILVSLIEQEPLEHIQISATVQSENSISITVRKEIQGITQRLGAITLKYDVSEAIELFEWCGAAAETSATKTAALAELTAKSRQTEAAVDQLKAQLEELIQAKTEDENALLQKFRDLLNEKKVKIREQQKILTSGSFQNGNLASSSQAPQPEEPEPTSLKSTRKAGKSRPAKRKTPASKRVEESEDEDFEPMEVDVKQEEETDPGNTTEDTASVATDDEDDIPETSQPPSKATKTTSPPKKAVEQPPAPRSLPFGQKKPTKPAPPPAAADSETDSGDEL